jgi:hypothetical protein
MFSDVHELIDAVRRNNMGLSSEVDHCKTLSGGIAELSSYETGSGGGFVVGKIKDPDEDFSREVNQSWR